MIHSLPMPLCLAEVSESTTARVVTSLLVIVGVLIGRWIAARFIRRADIRSFDLRQRWIRGIRTAAMLIVFLGLVIIWAEQIRTVALSLVAIAAAIVIATKELILCVSGSLLKVGAKSFSVGDRIVVKEFRGDVIDQTLLATTLMEVGPGRLTHQRTGRTLVLPNSLFVAEPVINEGGIDDVVLHSFTVPLAIEEDWEAARDDLLAVASDQCSRWMAEASQKLNRLSRDQALEQPSVEPRVTIQLPDPETIDLIVRVPVAARSRSGVEQTIITRFMHRRTTRLREARADRDEARNSKAPRA